MELINNNGILFDKTSHSYLLLSQQRLLIGLTSLMAKHNLGADYSGIPEKKLKEAAAKGTAIHEYLQQIDEGEAVFVDDLGDEYLKAIHEKGLKHICSEYLVSDNEAVATFIDKVYDTGEPGLVDLADVKTTYDYHRRSLEWQLGVNIVLFERQNPGLKVRNVFCIHIDKKTRKLKALIPVAPVSEKEVDALLDCERKGQLYVDSEQTKGAELILSDTELATYASSYDKVIEFKEKLKKAEEVLKEFDGRILKYLQDNNLEEMKGPGGITFKVKKAYQTTRVDSNALKTKYPAIYAKVTKQSTTSASLLVSKKEEE